MDFKKMGEMEQQVKYKTTGLTVGVIVGIMVRLGLLSESEADHALKTLELPRDIKDRLKRAELISKN
jgi:hypothetical protein